MKKKILSAHNEAIYHLINFRINQFTTSKKLLKMDYLSFMICSVVATHILYKNMLKNKIYKPKIRTLMDNRLTSSKYFNRTFTTTF